MGVRRYAIAICLSSSLLLLSEFARADSVQVSVGTAALSGAAGTLAFDFIDGDGTVNNSVSITNFTSDASLGSGITTGSVAGTFPGTVTLSDASFFNELLVPATLGSSISFTVNFTNTPGFPPDSFTFFLLDPAAINSLVSTDLLGNALLEIDMTGGPGSVLSPTSISPGVTVSVGSSTTAPEPSSLLLSLGGILSGLLSLTWRRTRKCPRLSRSGF